MALVLHPEFKLYERKDKVFCSSLQVAETFEKRHDHVLEDIAKIGLPRTGESSKSRDFLTSERAETITDFFSDNFWRTTYINSQNKKQPMYLMTEEGFTVLVMGYTGDKAMYFKIEYVKRFKAYESFIRNYILARDEFMPFTRAIEFAHEEPKSYHYSNEADMLNRIVLECTAKQFKVLHGIPTTVSSIRPYLSQLQAKAIRALQNEDIPMLYQHVAFQERKTALTGFYNDTLAIGG